MTMITEITKIKKESRPKPHPLYSDGWKGMARKANELRVYDIIWIWGRLKYEPHTEIVAKICDTGLSECSVWEVRIECIDENGLLVDRILTGDTSIFIYEGCQLLKFS